MENSKPMIYSKLFDEILAKPGLYVGNCSVVRIKAFIDGYSYAKDEGKTSPFESEDDLFFGFQAWIEERYNYRGGVHHWVNIVTFYSPDEVYAYERTKELWEEYKAAIQAETKILVSACILGQKVRYNGSGKSQRSLLLKQLIERDRVVAICPEVAGGLGVPRLPAEIQDGTGDEVLDGRASVFDSVGKDVTAEFVSGAQQALALAQASNVRVAILKARSPSCGNAQVYDGTFSKRLLAGRGVTAALLERHGIKVFNEDEIAEAMAFAAEYANED